MFTSYAPLANPRLAVVVISRGPDARKHFPAAVAGRIYRELNSRFGTPVNLQLATAPAADDPKAADLNEEEKDAAEADAAEEAAAVVAAEEAVADGATKTETPADSPVRTPVVTGAPAPRNMVKSVLMQIPRRAVDAVKIITPKSSGETKTTQQPPKSSTGDERPRRTQPN